MALLRSLLCLCVVAALSGCRTQLLADGGFVDAAGADAAPRDGGVTDGSLRDLPAPFDEGPAVDLAGPQARTGLPCGGLGCGFEQFCVISDVGGGQPSCERVPNCLMSPTCACFTGQNSTLLECFGAMCVIDQQGEVICKH